MEHVQISAYTLQEQLEVISQATVLVSNIGSRSFRLIYLPNGATTILVGPPECGPPALHLQHSSHCTIFTFHCCLHILILRNGPR